MAKTLITLLLAGAMVAGVAKLPKRHDAIPAQAAVYRDRVIREAHAAGGLDAPVALFAAQIHQESQWKPTAQSGVGAMGLAQFMPGTAAWIANLYPLDMKPGAPFDADWAIRALVRYDFMNYKSVSKFKDGDDRWAAALSAYNGGLGWVYKDQKAASCDASLWFSCVALVIDKRTPANYAQNRGYPERIIHKLKPLYEAALWK